MTLTVAVVCEEARFAAWQARCLEMLTDVDGVHLAVAIVNRADPRDNRHGRSLWSTFWSRHVLRRSRALRPADVDDLLAGIPRVRVDDESLAAALAPLELDVVVELSGPAPESLIESARRGMWSLRPTCDGRDFGDDAPGLREILDRNAVTTAELLGRRKLDSPTVILGQAFLRTTAHSYVRTLDDVLFGAAALPARALRTIIAGGDPVAVGASEHDRERRSAPPTNRETLGLAVRTGANFVRSQTSAVIRAPQWNVGIVDAPIHRFVDESFEPRVRWNPRPPRGLFVADPFGLPDGSGCAWLVESYDYSTGRGVISAVDPRRPAPSPASVLPVASHASYPYLLRVRGEIYCVPQLDGARDIRAFRAVRYPDEWEEAGVLLADVAARDPTIFEHEGRWWLAYTEASAALTDLHLWWADDPFSRWTPHAANPVKIDARSARPAGTPFVHGGHLYRPAQDCSHAYGGAVAICRIDVLTPTDFREEVVRVVRELPGSYRHGTHTLASVGDTTLVDGKRLAFTVAGARRALTSRLQRTSS